MKQTFFITLREIKENLYNSKNPNYINITDETRQGFKEFTSFVEECALFPGKRFYAIQYVCKHWYLSGNDLHIRYNRETGKQTSNSAFSQTITRASMAYSKVFGVFDLYEVFDGKHNDSIDDLLLLCDLIVQDVESGLVPIFISEVYDYNTTKKHGTYALDECKNEIAILKETTKRAIFDKLDTVDSDKLLYLLDVSKQSLFNTKDDSINQNKFKLLTYLKGAEYDKYKDIVESEEASDTAENSAFRVSEIDMEENSADKNVEGYGQSVAEDETLDFGFDADLYDNIELDIDSVDDRDKNVTETVENKLDSILSYIRDFDYAADDGSTVDEKEVLKATKFLTLYTKDGLDKYLKGLSKDVMRQAFEKLDKLKNN